MGEFEPERLPTAPIRRQPLPGMPQHEWHFLETEILEEPVERMRAQGRSIKLFEDALDILHRRDMKERLDYELGLNAEEGTGEK